MDELVQRLAQGDQPLTAQRYSAAAELQQAIERGYVLVKFTATQGGTELGVRLERKHCDLAQADFAHNSGVARLAGTLTLNYVKVRVRAAIDLATLDGSGQLEILED